MIEGIGISYKFEPLWRTDIDKRYFLLTGGRGPGKSHATATWACDSLRRYEDWRILYTRYTLTSAEISIIPEFEGKLDMLHIRDDFDVTKKQIIHNETNSDIIFSGIKTSSANQTAKLKAIPGLNIFIVDEAEEFDSPDGQAEKDFDTIDFSIRQKGVLNRIVLLFNPPTEGHWIWKKWFDGHVKYVNVDGAKVAISTHPDVCHIHTTYLDNIDNLSPDFLNEVYKLRESNRDKYNRIIMGEWSKQAEGVIFENWEEGEFDTSLPYLFGLDPGYFPDPLAAIKVAIDKTRKRIYLQERAYETKLSTESAVATMANIVHNNRDLIVADTAEPRLTDAIRRAGYNIVEAEKGPDSIIKDIRDMQDYTLIVHPDSQNLKRELNNYAWNDKKASIPVDRYNHLIDAGRYGFRRLASPAPKRSKLRVARV